MAAQEADPFQFAHSATFAFSNTTTAPLADLVAHDDADPDGQGDWVDNPG